MGGVWQRLRAYLVLSWRMGAYGLLVAFWMVLLQAAGTHMAPRLSYLTAHRPIANDAPCGRPECDFSVFWPAGRLAREHAYATLYTPQPFSRAAATMLLPGSQIETFFYPPPMLLPVALISYLPFEWGFFVWTFGMLLLAAAVLRRARLPWGVILAGLLSPAALLDIQLGQVNILGYALFLAGLLLSSERRGAAGGLLGFLACKPQIGLLAPVVLLAQRNGRALGGFLLVVGLLVAMVVAIFGLDAISAYLTIGRAEDARVLDLPFHPLSNEGWGLSVFWMLRSLHAGVPLAGAVQAGVSLCAAGVCYWLWRQANILHAVKVEMTVFLALLATPFGYTGEMVAYSLVLAAAAQSRGWRIDLLDALFWLWPGICLFVSVQTGVLLTPLVVLLTLVRSWVRAGIGAPYLLRATE
ncbi:hypothetical protein GCM10010909_20830 [Acidocella aquatica]|uniref:DUF2029 domain-containing protein n=1 Tax=Acidocella aquatica TaxID=1922313 RepID=A0ABQ6A9W7_9PROT|nr:glycosyltransferase family 87 protein [Acidocella aquatica]GLR67402.1 hypothetical protein GCM10010909_20830 [Acidocella aquatica]